MFDEELMNACRKGNWRKVRRLIADDPSLLFTAEDEAGFTPAYWAARNGSIKTLKFMRTTILPLVGSRDQMFRNVFERRGATAWSPVCGAALGNELECLKFLVEHAPTGPAILEDVDYGGWSSAHYAASNDCIDALEFIVENAPSGIGVLMTKNDKGETPLNKGSKSQVHFTPRRIREIGFEKELSLVDQSDCAKGSFVDLVLGIIKDTIAVQK